MKQTKPFYTLNTIIYRKYPGRSRFQRRIVLEAEGPNFGEFLSNAQVVTLVAHAGKKSWTEVSRAFLQGSDTPEYIYNAAADAIEDFILQRDIA